MLKGFVRRGLFVGLVVSSCLAVILVVYGLTQQEEGDSTRPELKFVRVKIGMRTPEDLQYLKAMGIECPKTGDCVVIITEAQRRQLEKQGLKAKALTGLRPDKGPNQVEYKLVREIDFEKENVAGVVFGPKSITRSAMPQMAQRDYREILFYSPGFRLVNTYKQSERYTDVFPSKNLEYVGILTPLKIPTKDTIGKVRFTLINSKGEKLWEMEGEDYYDVGHNGYSISNNGIVIERDHSSGMVSFYKRKGNEIKRIKVGIGGGDPETEIGGGSPMMESMC